MNADEELGHEMYDNIKKLWVHVNRFKQDGIKVKPLPPELSNQYNFLRETVISMESCRVAADYRSGLSPSHPCSSLVQPGPVFLLLGLGFTVWESMCVWVSPGGVPPAPPPLSIRRRHTSERISLFFWC